MSTEYFSKISNDTEDFCFFANVTEYGLDPFKRIIYGRGRGIEIGQAVSGQTIDNGGKGMRSAVVMDKNDLARRLTVFG